MATQMPKKPLEDRIREAAQQAEEELRRVVGYINTEVVPEVRRNGSHALRIAATELQKLAEQLEESKQPPPPPPPPR